MENEVDSTFVCFSVANTFFFTFICYNVFLSECRGQLKFRRELRVFRKDTTTVCSLPVDDNRPMILWKKSIRGGMWWASAVTDFRTALQYATTDVRRRTSANAPVFGVRVVAWGTFRQIDARHGAGLEDENRRCRRSRTNRRGSNGE